MHAHITTTIMLHLSEGITCLRNEQHRSAEPLAQAYHMRSVRFFPVQSLLT